MMIDIDKQYRTRDGREVRIYATGGDGDQAIHGAVLDSTEWRIYAWYSDGQYTRCEPKCKHDLIEVRPRIKRSYWVNLYPSSNWTLDLFDTREKADGHAGSSRVACVRVEIDCEHGEGL